MKLTDFQAYNAVNNKMIKIFIPTGIKNGLLTYEPPNNLEIKADTGIDDFIIIGITAVIVKTF